MVHCVNVKKQCTRVVSVVEKRVLNERQRTLMSRFFVASANRRGFLSSITRAHANPETQSRLKSV